jgi:hypothetical protein
MVHYQDRSKLLNHHPVQEIIPANTSRCNNITGGCRVFAVALFEANLIFHNCVIGTKSQRIYESGNRTKDHKVASHRH